MNRLKLPGYVFAALTAALLSGPISAHDHMMGSGPGNMPGQGGVPGMMQGYGPMIGYGYGHMTGYGMAGPMMGGAMGMGMMPGGYMMCNMPCPMMGGMPYGAAPGFQLNDEQQQKMQQIREQLWQHQQENMQHMWSQQQSMHKLWQNGMPSNEQILDAHRNMQKNQLDMLKLRLEMHEEMQKVLTDEQRQQLREMQKRMYQGGQ